MLRETLRENQRASNGARASAGIDSGRMRGASASGPPARRRNFARRASLCLLGLAAFEATAAVLRAITPWPEEYGLRPKHDWFVAHKGEYDVLFLGTSRTFRGIDPRIVDAELERAGVRGEHGPIRTFNFGIGGMLRFETDYVLDRLLEEEPRRLKVVVVEGEPWDPATDFIENTWSSRSVFWHDWTRTRLALHSITLQDVSLREKWRRSWIHLQLAGMKLHDMGQGSRIVMNWLGKSSDPYQRSLTLDQIAQADGYQAYEEFLAPGPTTWQAMLEHDPARPQAYRDRVHSGNTRPPDFDRYNIAALRSQQSRVKSAGMKFVVLLNPGEQGAAEERGLYRRGVVDHMFDFNRPDLYPQYWDADARIDDLHLSRSGAEELSKAVAAELAKVLRSGG